MVQEECVACNRGGGGEGGGLSTKLAAPMLRDREIIQRKGDRHRTTSSQAKIA